MIFQDNIVKKYLQIHSNKYGILNNFYFYCKESFIYNKLGFILSLFLVPAGIIKSLASIFIPKLVIDSLGNFKSEYTFLINIIIVTVVIAVSSIVELLAKNTMDHNMNSFVLIQLNKLWVEKVSTMDYEVFTSELGKQSASKARMTLEGTTRWGIGTYIPRLLELLTSFIGFIIYGVMLVYVHPLVLAALITAYAVNMVVTLYAEKKKQMLKDDAAKAERKMNYFAYSTRGLSIAKDIRVYSMREWISQMAEMARLDKKIVDDKVQSYQLFVFIVNGIVVLLRDGLVYLILIWLTLKGDITIGSFALYAAAVNGLGEWLAQITTGVGAFRESDNNVTDFRQFLSLPDGKTGSEEKLELSGAPSIELDSVSFSYDGKNNVLDNVSLKVKPGEKIAVVGSNGAGKTTFSRALCGLHKDCDGQFLWESKPIERKERLQRSYMVMQDVNYELFADSVEAECSFGIRNPDQTLVNATLEELGLSPYREQHPNTLSGGQKQRVAVAVSMICGKDLLVFDEPTSGLDFDSMTQVAGLIRRLSDMGKVIFIVTHDFEFVCRTCSRVLHFDEGEIPDDVLVTMDALPKLRELFSVKVNVPAGDREGGLGRSDGKER